MKKLSAEEGKNLKPVTHGRTTLVSAIVSNLLIGEVLLITRADWKSKNPPYQVVGRVAQKPVALLRRAGCPMAAVGW